jgi:FkbM family methyltransferase
MNEENPIIIVDVGAGGGVDNGWSGLPTGSRVIGFEPDEDECRRLNAIERNPGGPRVDYIPVALGKERASVPFYRTVMSHCSSTLRPIEELRVRFPTFEGTAIESARNIELVPLDDWCHEQAVFHVDFIKLDTQGSELDILSGAKHILDSTLIVETEVELNPLYENQPLFGDVDAHLRSQGFELWTLDCLNFCQMTGLQVSEIDQRSEGGGHSLISRRPAGQLMWAQAFFVRGELLRPSADPELVRKRQRAVEIAQARGLDDLAHTLAQFLGADGRQFERNELRQAKPLASADLRELDDDPAELENLREELRVMRSSRSYRYTRPLRFLRSKIGGRRA